MAKITTNWLFNPSENGNIATWADMRNIALYPFNYLVVTQNDYTKYYYAGGARIASKLGSGGFEKMQRLCTENLSLTTNANALFNSVVARIGEDMPQDYQSIPCTDYYSEIAGFRVQLPVLNFEPNFGAGYRIMFRKNYGTEELFFYHNNHMESVNWVTSSTATPTQFVLQRPYGEEFVMQWSGSYDERFIFTGKERDVETGYYYFGARFDNVDLGFLSVDPMADKYPSISPYAYCAWNPVKLVDPEGENGVCIVKTVEKKIVVRANYYVLTHGRNIIKNYRESQTKYTISEINEMQIEINDKLNKARYRVSEGEYEGYNVEFDLRFVGSENFSDIAPEDVGGASIDNLFQKMSEKSFTDKFGTFEDKVVGGYVENAKFLFMNSNRDDNRNRIHEIFHTLFFNNDAAAEGIGSYTRRDYPNQLDINMLINNPNLKKVIE